MHRWGAAEEEGAYHSRTAGASSPPQALAVVHLRFEEFYAPLPELSGLPCTCGIAGHAVWGMGPNHATTVTSASGLGETVIFRISFL